MRLIPGGNLAHRGKEYVHASNHMARLMATIARVVHHAHRRRLIHRELRPSNIRIVESRAPLIADLGLVKRSGESTNLTAIGEVLGTPTYMAPEQISGGRLGPTADVYRMGAILYQLLTACPQFRASTVAETLSHMIETDPAPPRQIRASIPRELEYVCLKCLGKDAGKRYGSAASMAKDLDRCLLGHGIHRGRVGMSTRLSRWIRREAEFTCRLLGQALTFALMQVNFLLHPSPDVPIDAKTSAVEVAWICASLIL